MPAPTTTAPLVFRRKPAYSSGEVAALLGISATSVRRALTSGDIPGGYLLPKPSRHRRITDQALGAYLKADPSLADILARFEAAR